MALDRDLGVAVVRAIGRPLDRGWEMTAATGVRGLRLLREGSAFREFAFTETSRAAYEVLRQNLADEPRAVAFLGDGSEAPPGAPFDYVDVDPYGSPLPFLDSAFASTRTGGVLAVTATDMPVLAGAQPSACRRRYGAAPVRGRLGPEGGLRILLMVLAREARRTGRSIRPLLAYVGGHHVRAYVELRSGIAEADPVRSVAPEDWTGPPLEGTAPFGPFWLGPIVDRELAGRLEVPATAERARPLRRFLDLLRDDAEVDRPFYYEANTIAERLGLPRPPALDDLLAELRREGYRAARTHVRPEGLRTEAPRPVVEAAARSLVDAGQSQNARVRA